MKKHVVAGLFLAGVCASAAVAGVISDRQTIMKGFNTASMQLRGIAQGNTPYDDATVKAQLQVIVDGAAKIPTMFPAGSDVAMGEDTPHALPAVWADSAGFQAAAAKLGDDAKAAMAATDQASFAPLWQAVQGDCGGCHRTFREQQAGRGGRGPGGGGPGGGGGAPPAGG